MLKILAIIVSIFSSQSALACLGAPSELFVHQDVLIERTENIVLAQVSSAKVTDIQKEYEAKYSGELLADIIGRLSFGYDSVEYTFKTLVVLKGKSEETFTIEGSSPVERELSTFDDHQAEQFKGRSGRLFNGPDCRIRPTFDVAGVYLIFLGEPYHSKGFEKIRRIHKDKWYSYVKSKLMP